MNKLILIVICIVALILAAWYFIPVEEVLLIDGEQVRVKE